MYVEVLDMFLQDMYCYLFTAISQVPNFLAVAHIGTSYALMVGRILNLFSRPCFLIPSPAHLCSLPHLFYLLIFYRPLSLLDVLFLLAFSFQVPCFQFICSVLPQFLLVVWVILHIAPPMICGLVK